MRKAPRAAPHEIISTFSINYCSILNTTAAAKFHHQALQGDGSGWIVGGTVKLRYC